ncbi:hypothetical protein FXO37_04333 [Capsicum annuum]|nr:hypothetical protein FXO37_04333 [Capsicum annuum]
MPVSSYPVQVFRFASKLVLAAYGLSAGACDRRLYLRGGFPSIVGHMIYDGYKWARSRRAMSLLAVAQPSIEATSTDCDSTCPWIKALSRSRRRCATGLTLFLPAWGVAMDAKMKTPQRQLGGARDSWIKPGDKVMSPRCYKDLGLTFLSALYESTYGMRQDMTLYAMALRERHRRISLLGRPSSSGSLTFHVCAFDHILCPLEGSCSILFHWIQRFRSLKACLQWNWEKRKKWSEELR